METVTVSGKTYRKVRDNGVEGIAVWEEVTPKANRVRKPSPSPTTPTMTSRYAFVALVSCAVTALAFGGFALAYEAHTAAAPAKLECSTAFTDAESDFSDMYDIDAKESVRLYCKINRQAPK